MPLLAGLLVAVKPFLFFEARFKDMLKLREEADKSVMMVEKKEETSQRIIEVNTICSVNKYINNQQGHYTLMQLTCDVRVNATSVHKG